MKGQYVFVLFILFFIGVFSGCLENPLEEESTFLSTSESVGARFLDNAPPENVFIEDRFNIWLEVENAGEKGIGAGEIRVDLTNSNLFRHYYQYNLESQYDFTKENPVTVNTEYGVKNRYASMLWWMKQQTKYSYPEPAFEYKNKFDWAADLGCEINSKLCNDPQLSENLPDTCVRNCLDVLKKDLEADFSYVPSLENFVGDEIENIGSESELNDHLYVELNPTRYNVNFLRPARKDFETGDRISGANELIMFDDLGYVGGESITEQRPISISAGICYPYETEGISTICVTKKAVESEICDPIAERKAETSSGPVHLKAVEQKTNGYASEGESQVITRIDFVFEKADLKKNIFSGENCSEKVSPYDKGIFEVTYLKIGTKEYSVEDVCGTNKVEFRSDGTGRLSCKFPINGVYNDYLERIVIKANYLVLMETSTEIHIMPTV